MEPLTIAAAAVVLFVVIAWVLLERRRRRRERTAIEAHQGNSKLTVLETRPCGDCRHFDLDAGQMIMGQTPDFVAATRHLLPWQMGRKREVDYNPEYLELEAKLEQAIKDRDYTLQSELTDKMMTMDPGRVRKPSEYVPPEMLRLKWQDFGACAQHEELRANTDTCADYAPKLQSVKDAS